MKKLIRLLFFIVLVSYTSNAQVSNSVLNQGNWFKFTIDTTGVFKIDKSLLEQIGISTNGLNPKTLKIYGNGGDLLPMANAETRYDDLQQNAIYVKGEADGVFNDDDYILFYGVGPHSWKVNPTTRRTDHVQNIYTDVAYYFITAGGNNGKRITAAPEVTTPATRQETTYDDYTFYEKENLSLFAVGQQWFGEGFNVNTTQNFQLPFDNAVPNSNITVKVAGVAASSTISYMEVKVNNQSVPRLEFAAVSSNRNNTTFAHASERTATINNSATTIAVELTYDNNGNPSAKGYLDYIEVLGKKQLRMDAKQFSFRSFTAATVGGVGEYQIQNGAAIFEVWEVTDRLNPKRVKNQSSGANFSFKSNGGILKEYVAINAANFYTPKVAANRRVANQNLHGIKDINYLLITNRELQAQAQRIADYHQTNSGYTVEVVLLDQIYNEFASGAPDIAGIRDFIRHVYRTNTIAAKKLKYVCFFGDASYDFKDRVVNNNNIVPAYQSIESFDLATSYVTDDFYAFLEDGEGNLPRSTTGFSFETLDVAVGRIPVSSVQQATEVVDKILSYYTKDALGDWRNTVTLLADDIDEVGEETLQEGMEKIADQIKKDKPILNVNKIYADAFTQQNSSGGERYPDVNNAITNAIEKGTLLLDYFGHGGEDGFASERILEKPQIQSFFNEKTLPLFVTVTCEFSRFDNPRRITAGELTFWNKRGGAASLITTTREVYITVGQEFNEALIKVLLEFNNEDLTIAESLAKVKNGFRNYQKLFIYYIGDPAMKLAIPKPNVRITKINGKDISQPIDTLKALSKVTFEGVVTDNSNTLLSNFNGTLSTTVFDKPIDKTTLDNDGFGKTLVFDSQESKLFKGKSSVTNGTFQFEFIVPKDIKIAYGKGKLSFYAENQVEDKSGFNVDVTVGGINTNAPDDTVGPEIKLFMNDESFIDGGNTNSSPNIIASLSDASGINTSVTAVDHDIIAILDGDQSNPIVLNDYYETALNDFTKGKVVYRLRDLSVGSHTLKIKAWDTYNNSSEATLNFVVVSDAGLTLDNVLNYPNPFINYTEFWFNHNKPNEPLEVQVQIFTVSGKLIKTINQSVQTTGNLSRSITWNGLDDFGNKIGKGVYIYKLKVKSTSNQLTSEKYEKLVILR